MWRSFLQMIKVGQIYEYQNEFVTAIQLEITEVSPGLVKFTSSYYDDTSISMNIGGYFRDGLIYSTRYCDFKAATLKQVIKLNVNETMKNLKEHVKLGFIKDAKETENL